MVGGCVSQVGAQSFNIARTAWLTAGLPMETPATTVDSQCGSSQQATNLASSLVGAGVVDVAVACGVESMSLLPIGINSSKKLGLGVPIPKPYFAQYESSPRSSRGPSASPRSGASAARTPTSSGCAAGSWRRRPGPRTGSAPRSSPSTRPTSTRRKLPSGSTHRVERDEGLRETSLEALAQLKPVAREDGVHTAGTSSQVSDGAAAVLMMTADKAAALGLTPKARIVDTCLVGVDPVLMLTGPIDATVRLLDRNGMTMDDIDLVEINEAFASVVLAWAKELSIGLDGVNPNGGAIALGHPLGATGAFLMTKAVHELERADQSTALITMCCGGGLGTGTLIERM